MGVGRSQEVPARANEVGKLIVTDAGGHPMYVDGTREACLKYAKCVIKAAGAYPLKHADEIFRRSFTKLMTLKAAHPFDTAVEMLAEYHPSHLRPSEEELRKANEKIGQAKEAQKRASEELSEAKDEAKALRLAVVRSTESGDRAAGTSQDSF